ncbi:MAG: PQQ-binding-like beta-propeller repeat protein [Acidobacteria bacterium]|nr:PQQ-binding-like beta-propeller repeat protein [Acidobacteriota bacterium]
MRRFYAILAVLVLVAAVQVVRVQRPFTNWTDYGGTADNARHVALSQIDKANLNRLGVAWSYPSRDTLSYVFNPIVVDNVAYVLARNNSLVALDATTGKEIWIHEDLRGIAPRGINYWESKDRSDRRLLFQMNSYLQAIDARTGKSIMTFGTDGVVNLREGLRRDPATLVKVQSSNPGKVFENLIILGSAAGEHYMAPPGDIRAFDVVTGKLVWQFHTVPHPGEFGYDTWPPDAWQYVGGANTWGELSVDAERGIAYVPTGSPTYDYYGADRHGANLFGSSLVALDARTGKRLWHFQMVHHDLWDYDNTAAPQLATITHNGVRRDIVAQAGKTGYLYVFDRVTGEPIWPIEEKPFPASDIPGEKAWPTQPVPTAPPPFSRQSLTAAEINPFILTSRQRTEWQKRISSARNEGLFTPPSYRDTVSIPGAQGGANWGTTAADPARGIVYVLGINVPSIYKLSSEAPRPGGLQPVGPAEIAAGHALYEQRCQSCHGGSLTGGGSYPSLIDVTGRLGAMAVRDKVIGGGPGMPPTDDLTDPQLTSLIGFLANPSSLPSGATVDDAPALPPGPVVATGAAPAGRVVPDGRAGGMIGPDYPKGIRVPEIRMYTGYGMNGTIVKPPYSTLTAYDLNTGTIKWQVPAGGDDARTMAEGGKDTGYILQRTGIITTSTGLLFQAGGDRTLRVYDADTGAVLWTTALPAGSRGIPVMYEAGGRQFFLVNATSSLQGSGAGRAPAAGAVPAYVAFALPEASAK